MAGGPAILNGQIKSYPGRTTFYVVFVCIVAASGGLIFGYDIGISGGVTSMDSFLQEFFPEVYEQKVAATQNDYCKFDSQALTAFTSSLYLAGLFASFAAAQLTRNRGRIPSILLGGVTFFIGAILNGAAVHISMLILGRILLGVGVGFTNQAVPLYLSEMAPPRLRGGLNVMFQMAITIGILIANLVNYATKNVSWGWRVSLGLAAVPAVIMFVGALFLPETPNSLVEREHFEEAVKTLKKIRGTSDVNEEFKDLVDASSIAKQVQHPFRNFMHKRNRPQAVLAVLIPTFQQLTGINVIMFYAPVLFQTLGFGAGASLYSAVITGVVNVIATVVAIVAVDRLGRRFLFIEAGVQMITTQVIIGVILKLRFGGDKELSSGMAGFVVVLICLYVSSFAWSWGPLGWLVPSEIFPLEIRSAGQSITVAVNLLFTFIIAQAFLTMLCHLQYGTFFFFGAWVVIMTLFVFFLLPETKNVPIEEMALLFRAHWFWGKVIPKEESASAVEMGRDVEKAIQNGCNH